MKNDFRQRLDREEANRLWDLDLLALGAAADLVRRRLNPAPRVTYVIDRNINYTNICVSGCRFCAFYRPPGTPDGYVLAWDELAAKLQELKDHGGSGVLLQGGLNPELGPDYYEKLIGSIRASGLAVHGFSPPEVVYWAEQWGLTIEEVIRRLIDAGLSSIPGGGAEILVDRVRQKISPNKCDSARWLEVMATAHELGLKTSATMMFGHLETRAETDRSICSRSGNYRTKPAASPPSSPGPSSPAAPTWEARPWGRWSTCGPWPSPAWCWTMCPTCRSPG